ncbi:NDP-hexose 2,3-dehydratase [Prauserella marina]|uniref:Oxidase EvaA n=1 Tax=Prauserella marina TaxID=530584 RepID=A0A222VM23_9PSEU|nr:NDP-hexose 2,3-dehydratase family protein [Prauserella marina]ASR34892.1 NDP-hexose 2,3-dehydratase [Prauserella marina]PWV85405.1 oxidase EvaA [Prauserella marina]SDC55615.1 oxidase EvaA [Prauserella marina]
MTNHRQLLKDDRLMPLRIAESAREPAELVEFHRWLAELGERMYTRADRVPLSELTGWHTEESTGNLRHDSGKFFTVEGLDIHMPGGPVAHWSQPIIHQPEIGILGILVKQFDGVLHCLMQAKAEPGNCNGLQLSPTVQATRSNYTRVHRGKPVPYLEYFQDTSRHNVIVDVRQSEQGSWFQHKRNRNMVVEVAEEVELLDGFCWLTLGQVHRLFREDNLIAMDARTVLSCLPFAGTDLAKVFPAAADEFHSALFRSCDADEGSLHSADSILSWITESRTRTDVFTNRIPLHDVAGWYRTEEKIAHERDLYFDVIGLDVDASGREVGRWTQPVIEPHGVGVVAFLAQVIGGVLHVLVHARVEPGFVDAVELAPTVQCIPENFDPLPPEARPMFLDYVLNAKPDQIRFDTELSEEGGRFYHARNRYLVIELDTDADVDDRYFRWMPLHQLVDLLRHSHYLNVQARSLVACLHSLSGA